MYTVHNVYKTVNRIFTVYIRYQYGIQLKMNSNPSLVKPEKLVVDGTIVLLEVHQVQISKKDLL
jgi:hypothetical protein